MVRRVRKKKDVMFLIAAALIIAFIWGWIELDGKDDKVVDDDWDDDGMKNSWEEEHGLDPNDPSDAALDPDNDGRTNLQEFENNSNPHDPPPPPPPPENITFSVYIRNHPNDNNFNVSLQVDGEELFSNLTVISPMRQADDTFQRVEGNHTFKATAVNLTDNSTLIGEEVLELSASKTKLIIDVFSDRVELSFAAERPEAPPACAT